MSFEDCCRNRSEAAHHPIPDLSGAEMLRMSDTHLPDVRHPPAGNVGHALCVFEMTGGPEFARNVRATGEWI
jgi:hypothetical protein